MFGWFLLSFFSFLFLLTAHPSPHFSLLASRLNGPLAPRLCSIRKHRDFLPQPIRVCIPIPTILLHVFISLPSRDPVRTPLLTCLRSPPFSSPRGPWRLASSFARRGVQMPAKTHIGLCTQSSQVRIIAFSQNRSQIAVNGQVLARFHPSKEY